MNQILRCDWIPERARWSYLARSGQPAVSRKENFPESHIIKSFIDQACSVKMAGYWPRSFFASLWTSTSSRSINARIELGQYPASHLDLTLGQQPIHSGLVYGLNCLDLLFTSHRSILLIVSIF